jgi:hypothetical protein
LRNLQLTQSHPPAFSDKGETNLYTCDVLTGPDSTTKQINVEILISAGNDQNSKVIEIATKKAFKSHLRGVKSKKVIIPKFSSKFSLPSISALEDPLDKKLLPDPGQVANILSILVKSDQSSRYAITISSGRQRQISDAEIQRIYGCSIHKYCRKNVYPFTIY